MKKWIAAMAFVLALTQLFGCSSVPKDTTPSSTASTSPTGSTGSASSSQTPEESKPDTTTAVGLLETMTLEQMVAQLFIIRPEALDPNLSAEEINDSKYYAATKVQTIMSRTLRDYPVGGIILFSKNIDKPDQLTAFVEALKSNNSIPMFMGIDEEGGLVSRIANDPDFDVPKFQSNAQIGASGQPSKAWQKGSIIGTYLKKYGVNLNFAPVADVVSDPEHSVIGDRSFGGDPKVVSSMVAATINGLHARNIMTCVKHFPGHGNTEADTHDGFVSISKTWEELKQCELIPFATNLRLTDMVMMAHITAPEITDDGRPASLSQQMVTEKLRGELGFRGVVVTDSLSMKAITDNYSSAEAAVLALEAGVDILLMPEDFMEAYEGILEAVKSGRLSQDRIKQSVLRILMLKEKYGMLAA